MKRGRLEFIGFAVLVAVASVATFVFFVWQINQHAAALDAQLLVVAEEQKSQQQLAQMEKIIEASAADRDAVAKYYLTSAAASFDFLTYIEDLALQQNIELETVNPKTVTKDEVEYLQTGYSIRGSRAQVEQFVVVLENIPYVSEVTSLSLQKVSTVVWEADVQLSVRILTSTYETE